MTIPRTAANAGRPSPLLGREALLRALEIRLQTEARLVIGVDPALKDRTGVGRTRLVTELVSQLETTSTHVLHLCGSTPAAFHGSLLQTAQQLSLHQNVFRRAADLTASLRSWLSSHDNWLMVIDSVADLEDLQEITEGVHTGRMIVVLSEQAATTHASWPPAVPLGSLSADDALRVLQTAIARDWENTPEVIAATRIVQHLERNPRCAELAGRCMQMANITPIEYLQSLLASNEPSPLRSTLKLLLTTIEVRSPAAIRLLAAGVASGAATLPGSVVQAISQQLVDQTLDPLQMLMQCGLMRTDSTGMFVETSALAELQQLIPATTLCHAASVMWSNLPPRNLRNRLHEHVCGDVDQLPDPLAALRVSLGQTIATLKSLDADQVSMLRQAADAATDLLLPSLAQKLLLRVLDQSLQSTSQASLTLNTLVELGAAYVAGEQFQLARRRWRQAVEFCPVEHPLLTELLLAIAEIDVNENRLDRAAGRLGQVSEICRGLPSSAHNQLLRAQRKYLSAGVSLGQNSIDKARDQFRAALDLRLPLLPVDHPLLLRNRLMLARTEFLLKDYVASEKLLLDEVSIRENSPRVSESEFGVACNFLAEQYYLSGRLSEAEPVYDRTMIVRRSTLPRGHRLIGEMANRLAVIKSARGAYKEADSLFRESLATLEQTYGPDHPEVARVLNDLAESLFSQNKVESARRLLERALNIQERALRANDHRLGRTRCNLAAVYVARGRFAEAVRLYEKDVTERQSQKTTDQASLATSLNNLAEALRSLGRYGEAESRLKQSLAIREKMVGLDHPQVAQILNNLGYLYLQQHRYEESREALQRALVIRETCLSATHPHVATTLGTLAEAYFTEGQFAAARPLYSRAIEIYSAVHGDRHPQVATLQVSSARNELRLGHVGRAELMLLRGKTTIEELLGADHRMSAKVMLGIAELAHTEKRYEQAFPLLERCLAIQYGTMSSQRLEISHTLRLISDNLMARGLVGEALPRIVEAVDIQRGTLGPHHPEIVPNILLIGRIQQQLGHVAEAEEALRAVLQYADANTQTHLVEEAREHLPDVLIQSRQYDEAVELMAARAGVLETSGPSGLLLTTLTQLAGVHYLRSTPQAAAPLMERCVELSEQLHGSDSAETAKHLDNLAGVRFLLGQYESAEPAIQRAIEILEQERPVRQPALVKARENYIQLLRQTNRPIEADQLAALVTASQAAVEPPMLSGSHVLDDL